MLTPEIQEVKSYLQNYGMAPVFYEFLSDSYTPVHIYKALSKDEEVSFILESVNNAEQWGRYSFIGIHPEKEIKIHSHKAEYIIGGKTEVIKTDNPVDFITKILDEYKSPKLSGKPNLTGGLIGYFGYDTVRYTEKKLTDIPNDDIEMPDCHLYLYDEIVAYDHLSSKVIIIFNINRNSDVETQFELCESKAKKIQEKIMNYKDESYKNKNSKHEIIVTSNVTREDYIKNVINAKEHIVNGDIFQIVLSQRFEIENPPDSFDVYRMLRVK